MQNGHDSHHILVWCPAGKLVSHDTWVRQSEVGMCRQQCAHTAKARRYDETCWILLCQLVRLVATESVQ